MKFKTTFILLLLVLAVGGYVFFVDRYKPSTAELKQTEKRVLKNFRPELITRIVIQRQIKEGGTGRVTRVDYELEKEALGWKLVKPVNFPVNTPLVRQILDNIKKMDQHRFISGHDYENMNRDQTGLNNPEIIATFETPQTSVVLRVGAEVPMGWEYYAELKGKRQAYFIPNQLHEILCFETDSSEKDVRRRRVFDVSPEYVNAVQMVCDGNEIDFRRGKDALSWYVTTPVYDRADDKSFNEFIRAISKTDVLEYVDQPRGSVDFKYSLTLVQLENSQRVQITDPYTVTNEWDEVNSYCLARRTEYGQYFTLDPKVLQHFNSDVNSYRAKTMLAPPVIVDLERLVVRENGKDYEMYYDSKLSKWDMPSVITTLKDELAIEDYAFLWLTLPVERFVEPLEAKEALQNKAVELTLLFTGQGESENYALSAPKDGLMYIERLSNVFVAVSAEKVRELSITNDFRFLTRQALNVPASEVERLEITGTLANLTLDRGTNFWMATENNKSRQILPLMQDEILKRMPVLVSRYVKEISTGEEAAYGLEKPYLRLKFILKNGNENTISLGDESGDGRFAMAENQPYVMQLNAETTRALLQFVELGRLYRE